MMVKAKKQMVKVLACTFMGKVLNASWMEQNNSPCRGGITNSEQELTSMVSHPNLLCLLEGVKTDMKPVGFQDDQIQILMKMKIMKGRDGKEVRELLVVLVWKEEKKREGNSVLFHGFSISLSSQEYAVNSEPLE